MIAFISTYPPTLYPSFLTTTSYPPLPPISPPSLTIPNLSLVPPRHKMSLPGNKARVKRIHAIAWWPDGTRAAPTSNLMPWSPPPQPSPPPLHPPHPSHARCVFNISWLVGKRVWAQDSAIIIVAWRLQRLRVDMHGRGRQHRATHARAHAVTRAHRYALALTHANTWHEETQRSRNE